MFEDNPTLKKGLIITFMLVFGTCTVVTQKIVLKLDSEGKNGETHEFNKPWFQTEVMFIGMMGCLIVYEILGCVKSRKAAKESETMPLMGGNGSVQDSSEGPSKFQQYLYVMAPAACDMIATASMNLGLLWIPASVWQMLRGSMVIFSALFSKFFLKRKQYLYHWVGVGVVVFALCVVALASLMQGSDEDIDTSLMGLGIVLVVAAQVIQASQIVIEEHLLKGISIDPILIVGLEGLWGGILSSIMLFIMYWVPSPPGEDTIDSFYMLGNNVGILFANIFYAVVILCYNLFGMLVTQVTTAVIRTILEALRTACVWVVNIFIHYVIVEQDPKFGEAWTDWSYLQLCGFIFLLLGLFFYNGIIRVNGLYYPDTPMPAVIRDEDADADIEAS